MLAGEETAATLAQAALGREQAQISELQEQLRKNLGALGDSAREVTLRDRLLDDLEASEERRRAISAARQALEQQTAARAVESERVLAALYTTT